MDALRNQFNRALEEQDKDEVVDCEFVEVVSEDVHQLCTACLCATRTTHRLDDVTLKQYYMNILTETQLEAGESVLQSLRLCWECVAHLKRSVRFREQVQDSYRLLQPMLLICDKEDLEFLQTSVCRPGRLRTCFVYSVDISPQDDVAKTMTAEQHDDDDDGVELLLLQVKEEREDEQLQETDTHPRKDVTKYVNTIDNSNSINEFTHVLKSTFTCYYCYQRFSSKPALERHIVTLHMSCNSSETGNRLRQLLSSGSVGRVLLTKADKGEKLSSRDRAVLVKIIVEAELNDLEEHSASIRKDVWQKWAKEVADLFADENADFYYVPFHVINGKAIQASGFFHNRLITHRRCINSLIQKRSKSTRDSDSGARSSTCEKNPRKRVPLPEDCNQDDTASYTGNIEWLKPSSSKETGKRLRKLLSSGSVGRVLLRKADKGEKLTSRDRALLVKIIVEAELNALEEHSTYIRKDVWQKWAKEVADLFADENADLYYVPFHVITGKAIQASGLFHNRLITHRRCIHLLAPKRSKRSSDRCEENSCKRNRPLPENFHQDDTASSTANIEWLKVSSTPNEMLIEKWNATLKFRQDLVSTSKTIKQYCSMFPGLHLPDGYKLLSSDFEALYPNAAKTFEEKFPLVKTKILTLLAELSDSVKPDQSSLDLLNLATVSEEHANLAAFLSITKLMRQMPTICVPNKKVWKLSREDVRSAFIANVSTAADIDKYCADREALFVAKGIPEQPYIIAVGASWATVTQYEVVVFRGLRYQLKNICKAVTTAYYIHWALDCAYSKDSEPCWLFVQRTMFDMVSKFDTEGVPLRELLSILK